VYICFDDRVKVENKVAMIEESLGINHFHWANFGSKAGWRVREKFISAISQLSFTFKLMLFTNPIHFASAFEVSLEHLIIEKKIDNIIIDGKKSRRYALQLKKVLRDKGISVKKIRTANDISSPGLRLADAVAGLYRSHTDRPTETTLRLYRMLENKKTVQLVGGQITR
jgi:hypothetical protein